MQVQHEDLREVLVEQRDVVRQSLDNALQDLVVVLVGLQNGEEGVDVAENEVHVVGAHVLEGPAGGGGRIFAF